MLGFIFGILQMILYVMYNKKEKVVIKEQNLPELKDHVIIIEDDKKKLPELSEEQIINIIKLGSLVYSDKNYGNLTEVAKNDKAISKLQTLEA